MGYLITQIIVCLLIAALIGFILGWLLRGLGCKDSGELDDNGSNINKKSTMNSLSSSDSSSLETNQADDFYPEPVTIAPAKPRKTEPVETADFSHNKSVLNTLSPSDSSPSKDTDFRGASNQSNDSLSKVSEKSNKIKSNTKNDETKSKGSDNKSTANTLSSSGPSSSLDSSSIETNQADDIYPEPITKAPTISHKIEKIEGIGKSLGNKIRKIGVKTTKDLLKTCSTKTGFQQVVEATKVPEDIVTQWVSMADLMRIPSVDGQIAELMLASGIKSPEVLAKANSIALSDEMATINRREKKVPTSIELPNAGKIAEMIKAAKTL